MIDERAALNLDKMQRAARDAISFLEGVPDDQLHTSMQLQMACAMCLIIIGEAAVRIEQKSPDFVAAHPDWPWNEMRGLRNRIVHDYFTLEVELVSRIVRNSLPALLRQIEAVGELDPRSCSKSPPHSGS